MGSTGVNQGAKPRVRNVVAVNPCRGLHIWSQQPHGATTPVLGDRFSDVTRYTQSTEGQIEEQKLYIWVLLEGLYR